MIDFDDDLTMSDKEILNDFYKLATMITFLKGKKLTLQNIFILILEDKQINKIAKTFLDMDTDFEICRHLLMIDPSLAKSKLIYTFAAEKNKEKNDE